MPKPSWPSTSRCSAPTPGMRIATPEGHVVHAELDVAGLRMSVTEEGSNPHDLGGSPVILNLMCDDPDALAEAFVANGGKVIYPHRRPLLRHARRAARGSGWTPVDRDQAPRAPERGRAHPSHRGTVRAGWFARQATPKTGNLFRVLVFRHSAARCVRPFSPCCSRPSCSLSRLPPGPRSPTTRRSGPRCSATPSSPTPTAVRACGSTCTCAAAAPTPCTSSGRLSGGATRAGSPPGRATDGSPSSPMAATRCTSTASGSR